MYLSKGSFTYRFWPPVAHLPRKRQKYFIAVLGKDTAFSRFWYLSCAISLPLAAIKIVRKHKVVCTQNLLSDPRLLYKQYKFCENRRNWPINLRQKLFYISFQDVSKKSKIFNKNIEFSHDLSKRTVTAAKPPPHPPTAKRTVTFLVSKVDMWGFPKAFNHRSWFHAWVNYTQGHVVHVEFISWKKSA